jgi:hypothetical protein
MQPENKMNKQDKALPLLVAFEACKESRAWVGDRSIEEAWQDCHRGDWMLWFYAKSCPENKRYLTLAKGHCANTIRHLLTDKRSLRAVDTAIAYGEGRSDDAELAEAAADAAIAADTEAAFSAAAAAADDTEAAFSAAIYAATAASDTEAAFSIAIYDASAAANNDYDNGFAAFAAFSSFSVAAYAAYAAAAKKRNLQLTSDICRQYLQI